MCLSKVYLVENGAESLVMDEVASLGYRGDALVLKTLLGETREFKARLKEVDLLTHRIVLDAEEA